MINASIVKFLKTNVPELANNVYIRDPLFVISEQTKPLATVGYLSHTTEQWVIGDAQRRQNVRCQLTMYHNSWNEIRWLTMKVQALLESITTTGDGGYSVPGIDLMGIWDLLYNPSGDLKTYLSNQPGWFASPAPIIYKNGDTVITSGFTIDRPNGKIIFGSAQALTDKFYATFKAGVIDFTITDIVYPQLTDIANKGHRYNSAITLSTWYYVKAIANQLY